MGEMANIIFPSNTVVDRRPHTGRTVNNCLNKASFIIVFDITVYRFTVSRRFSAGAQTRQCQYTTLPVSTASAQRSFSTLKRLKTLARNTIGQQRPTRVSLFKIFIEVANKLSPDQHNVDKY